MHGGNATSNTLIAAMDDEMASAILNASERVNLPVYHQLQAPNKPIGYVYFPESGIASLVADAPGRLQIETGLVGKEGMVGTILLSGIDQAPNEAFIQVAATARRLPVAHMRTLIEGSPSLQNLLIR